MSILIIAEHNNKQLNPVTSSLISAAQTISQEIEALVVGHQCQSVAEGLASLAGIKKVWLVDQSACKYPLAETIAPIVESIADKYTHIVAPATTFGKNFMPRLAALLDVAQISDITQIESDDTFVRPIYAGNALAKVQSKDTKKIITLRPTAFPPVTETQTPATVEALNIISENTLSQFVGLEKSESVRPELTSAKVVISGGRGLQSADNFHLLERIADQLNAAIGASRAAVDAGFVPNDYQVGQTGKIVAPELYIAVGISGAIQHLAGMKDSKVIVAINKDEDAPIFEVADYGLVADLFEALPALEKAIDELKTS